MADNAIISGSASSAVSIGLTGKNENKTKKVKDEIYNSNKGDGVTLEPNRARVVNYKAGLPVLIIETVFLCQCPHSPPSIPLRGAATNAENRYLNKTPLLITCS